MKVVGMESQCFGVCIGVRQDVHLANVLLTRW